MVAPPQNPNSTQKQNHSQSWAQIHHKVFWYKIQILGQKMYQNKIQKYWSRKCIKIKYKYFVFWKYKNTHEIMPGFSFILLIITTKHCLWMVVLHHLKVISQKKYSSSWNLFACTELWVQWHVKVSVSVCIWNWGAYSK